MKRLFLKHWLLIQILHNCVNSVLLFCTSILCFTGHAEWYYWLFLAANFFNLGSSYFYQKRKYGDHVRSVVIDRELTKTMTLRNFTDEDVTAEIGDFAVSDERDFFKVPLN